MSTAWDLPYAPLPPLQSDVEADVCVVGLGGTGLSAIRRLQRHRMSRIVGIDARQVAGGAAGRNGGVLQAGTALFHHRAVQAFGREAARQLYGIGLDALDRLERAHPGIVSRVGSLRLPIDQAERDDIGAHLAALRDDGLPALAGPGGEGLLVPGDGVFHPVEWCQTLADAAWEADAWLYGGTPAVEITDGAVRTPTGTVRCGVVLVCVDGGLDLVLPELADRVRSVRLQMLATEPQRDLGFRHATMRRGGLDYWHQAPDGRVLLGGCRDVGGPAEEHVHDAAPTEAVQAALDTLLRSLGSTAAVTHRWAGIAGYTHDHLPIVEEVREGVWAAGGYCGAGNVLGYLAGEALADMIAGRPRPDLLFALDAARAA